MGARPLWRDPRWWGERLLWLEQRPAEGGRTTLLLGGGAAGAAARELTPGPWNLRSRVHAYGGGAWCLEGDTAVVVHDGDRGLWRLDLTGLADPQAPLPSPVSLTPPPPEGETRAFADGLGATALTVLGEQEPGAPISRMEGGHWDGLPILSKSGAFGAPDFLACLLG